MGEPPTRFTSILITDAYYDHFGGATEMATPIYVASAKATSIAGQAAHPTNTPPPPMATVKSRLKILAYDSGPYLGFDESEDIYGDGTIVVPLPGHNTGLTVAMTFSTVNSNFCFGACSDAGIGKHFELHVLLRTKAPSGFASRPAE